MICHYEWHWKSKKGSSSENEDPVNLENAIEDDETGKNNWEVLDQIANYVMKYLYKHVSDK